MRSNKWLKTYLVCDAWVYVYVYMANGQVVNLIELNDKIYFSSLALSLS